MTGSTGTSAALSRAPRPTSAAVAAALAAAFLGAPEWTRSGLIAAGVDVLGARRRWLGPLVSDVLEGYRRPPVDAPRELAGRIRGAAAFRSAEDAARARGRPLPLVHHPLTPARAADTASHVPRLDGLDDLADLLGVSPGERDWFADTRYWNRRARPGPLQTYRYEWRTRPGRLPRLLEVPGARLRAVQRTVLREILSLIPLHDAAHGFVPGRSALTGAERHTGADVVIALDLTTFFTSVTAGRVYGTLRREGLPEAVAHSLTGMCTGSAPPRTITAMPPGGSVDERSAYRAALARPHLPQGASTSPALANLALRRLDSRLGGWADASGAVYTRYADDLAFSGGAELARRADAFVRGVVRIVADEGHRVNRRKTRVRPRSVRQTVTGIVVNERPNATRREFDRLKATLHNCAEHGAASQNRAGHPDFRAHLLGRIGWVGSLNPERGARLRREFDRIRW